MTDFYYYFIFRGVHVIFILFLKSHLYLTSHTIQIENHPWVPRLLSGDYILNLNITASMTPPPLSFFLLFSFPIWGTCRRSHIQTLIACFIPHCLHSLSLLPVLVSSGCCEAMTVVLAVDCEVTLAQLLWDTAVQQRSKAETRATNRKNEISSHRQLNFLIANLGFPLHSDMRERYFLLTTSRAKIYLDN